MVIEHCRSKVHDSNVRAQGHIDRDVLNLHGGVAGVDHENVLGLDVCVHHANLMQACTRGQQLLGDVANVMRKQGTEGVGAQEIVQRATERREH